MKISMWSSYYGEIHPEDMVLEYEKHGIAYGELSTEHSALLLDRGDPFEVGKAFKAFAEKHNVTFLQGHLELSTKVCEESERDYLKKELDLYHAIGITRAVLHVDMLARYGEIPVEEIRQRNLEGIRDLLDHIRGRDTIICLENIHHKCITETIEDIFLLIDALGSDQIGICLDTGHLNLSEDKDQVRFIKKAGKRLKALHLADNDGTSDQHLMPTAKGQVDFQAVIKALHDVNYDGLYNFEVPGEREIPLGLRGIKLEYMRDMLRFYWDHC